MTAPKFLKLHLEMIQSLNAKLDRDVILHIGRHKTGTSTLQHSLYQNMDRLAEQGIFYPCTGDPSWAHHEVARLFTSSGRPTKPSSPQLQAALQALANEVHAAPQGRVMISSEAFQNIKPGLLHAAFDPTRTSVYAYIREQYDYAQSSYCQAVQARKDTEDFASYLTHFNPFYDEFLRLWKTDFSPAEFRVQVYARAALYNGDVVQDFCRACGVDTSDFTPIKRNANASIGGPLLTFKREINALPFTEARLKAMTYNKLGRLAETDPLFQQKPTVPADQVAAYRARFTDNNHAVAKTWFDRDELFELKTPKEHAELPAQQELDAIERILAFFSSRKQSGFWDELCAHLAALPATASPYLHNLAKMSAKGKNRR
ncbi:MAG: hypothetical protein P8Q99_05185 [Paracoccaceae bacterium]|nr:hypothetical protein [Paracoccaceae bacterium]